MLGLVLLAACSSSGSNGKVLYIGAIPDQNQTILERLNGEVAGYLSRRLGVKVVYRPVTDYAGAVSAFRVGDLDVVWFGGFTGVQARRLVPSAKSLAQRDIDRDFHTVFIANPHTDLRPVNDAAGLRELKGHTFTFGSVSSTSGRLMPQYYLAQAGVSLSSFKGSPGFSGSHDQTIRLVESGTYDVGAVNFEVLKKRERMGVVKPSSIRVIWTTPGYPDYSWLARPDLDQRFGKGFTARLQAALLGLHQRSILELYGAKRFVPTTPGEYGVIEGAARRLGLLR